MAVCVRGHYSNMAPGTVKRSIDTRRNGIVYKCSLSERSILRALLSFRITLSPFSNVYGKRLQGSYAGACGFQNRILQVEEMSNTGENDSGVDLC